MTTPSQQAVIDKIMQNINNDVLHSADQSDPAVVKVFDQVSSHAITPAEGVSRLKSIAAAANLGKQTYSPRINSRRESNSSALIRMHTATAAVHYGVSTLEEAGPDADLCLDPTPLRAARDFLIANGATPSDNPRKTIMRAIEVSKEIRRNNIATDDFTSIYENLAHKMLTKGWSQSDQAYRRIVGNIEVINFKPYSQITAPEIPSLPKVPENSQIERFSLGTDSKETGQLETRGGIVGMTIRALVDGEVNPFLIGVQELVRAADNARADAAFETFTANSMTGPAMGDTNNLFSSAHSNWVASGGGAAPSAGTLATLRALMQKQTGPSGSVLNIRPRYLIVPVELQASAEVLVASMAGPDVSPLSRLSVLADARLDASSTTAWYLAADPMLHSGIDLATKVGANGLPRLEQRTRFATDGLEIKVTDDFHVQPVDWRALAGSFGA